MLLQWMHSSGRCATVVTTSDLTTARHHHRLRCPSILVDVHSPSVREEVNVTSSTACLDAVASVSQFTHSYYHCHSSVKQNYDYYYFQFSNTNTRPHAYIYRKTPAIFRKKIYPVES